MILSAPVAWLVNSSLSSHNISDNVIFQRTVMSHSACSRQMEWQYRCKNIKRIEVKSLESCRGNVAAVLTCPSHGKIYLLSRLDWTRITHCGSDWARLAKLWMFCFFFFPVCLWLVSLCLARLSPLPFFTKHTQTSPSWSPWQCKCLILAGKLSSRARGITLSKQHNGQLLLFHFHSSPFCSHGVGSATSSKLQAAAASYEVRFVEGKTQILRACGVRTRSWGISTFFSEHSDWK